MERLGIKNTLKDLTYIALITLGLTFLIWLPYILKLNSFLSLDFSAGFNTIYRNFDGINYIIIAKTLYDPQLIAQLPQSLPANYYAAQFPGYSLLILAFAPLLGFLKSMLFISILFTILSAFAFYFLVKDFRLTNHPLLLSIIFLILPARWLIVHSVGSAEPVFIFFTITTFYFFMLFEKSENYLFLLLAGLMGFFAQITRPPGVLIVIALGLYILSKLIDEAKRIAIGKAFLKQLKYFPLLLIPLGLLVIFSLYSVTYKDFFAYFHSGDNIHLTFPPFQVFNKHQFWVGDIWLEDILYVYIVGLLGGMYLFKKDLRPLGFFVFTYLAATMLVTHRDISRYALPIFPFVIIAFEKFLTSKEFRIALIIISLAIYLYSQNFIIENVAPFPNVELFN